MRCLGIDVATSCGWAIVDISERGLPVLPRSGVMILDVRLASQVKELASFAQHPWRVDVVGLEEPYLGNNPHALKVLARLIGRFEQAFGVVGIETVLVPAQTWQTAVLGSFGGKKREDRKKAARIWAKAMFGRDLPQDAADAAGLAYYLATKERA